jgi:hypothetical protein
MALVEKHSAEPEWLAACTRCTFSISVSMMWLFAACCATGSLSFFVVPLVLQVCCLMHLLKSYQERFASSNSSRLRTQVSMQGMARSHRARPAERHPAALLHLLSAASAGAPLPTANTPGKVSA